VPDKTNIGNETFRNLILFTKNIL